MPKGLTPRPRQRTRHNDVGVLGRRVVRGLLLLSTVVTVGSIGYMILGLSPLDALYQTVITVSTVGYREVGGNSTAPFRAFTMVVILSGVGTAFYTLGVLLETLVEGRLTDQIWRRRMDRVIDGMTGHVIVCGWGRVGQTLATHLARSGREVVIIDQDPERFDGVELAHIVGDATDDRVLAAAGIGRAQALVAALDTDAANLYVTLSGRSARPDLFIVARARVESAEAKLTQAGADRVVNPQQIGGERIAAMILAPAVADFLDVAMHDQRLEFRLAEVPVGNDSSMAGKSLRDTHLRDRTGALVLAMRDADGQFRTNPSPETLIQPGEVLIAIGTPDQLAALRDELGDGNGSRDG